MDPSATLTSDRDVVGGVVKDKSTAPIQITAEQLIREAAERLGGEGPARRVYVDKGDLQEYRLQMRRQYEDSLRRNRGNIASWLRYARFEIEQQDYARARSIFERALDVDPRNSLLWLRYAETEISLENKNLARNIWDRAVTILPRFDSFWYKYIKLEEMMGEIERAREIWNRWLAWEPDDQTFLSAVKFELRYRQFDQARLRFDKLIGLRPETISNWILYAQFEENDAKDIERARTLYERAIDHINSLSPKLFIEFAKFEVRQREIDRARAIYRVALQKFPPDDNPGLFNSYTQFEKSHGDPSTIDFFVYHKRKKFYEEKLKSSPLDYDTWFELVNLLLNSDSSPEIIKETFEKAIAQVPIIEEKRYWRRYIYLWLFYSLYCENNLKDRQLGRSILKRCLDIVPNSRFTFAKLWNELAESHIRELDLTSARKIFGQAIGMSKGNSNSVFKKYIEMEMQLREFDRVRTIYQKWLEYASSTSTIWLKWAELETLLDDKDRARVIYNLAVDEPEMDLPEVIWKSFIDFEYNNERYDQVRILYEKLLERTEHLKVWISYANFEANQGEIERARLILERASKSLVGYPSERMLLFEAWLELEQLYGDESTIQNITTRQPKKIKKKRQSSTGGWEEFFDYAFPDDESSKPSLKLLELAHSWKSQQQSKQQ